MKICVKDSGFSFCFVSLMMINDKKCVKGVKEVKYGNWYKTIELHGKGGN